MIRKEVKEDGVLRLIQDGSYNVTPIKRTTRYLFLGICIYKSTYELIKI